MREAGDDGPVPKPKHLVGEPLDTLSVEDLRLRIEMLHEEIARLDAAIVSKQASRNAADAFFRR